MTPCGIRGKTSLLRVYLTHDISTLEFTHHTKRAELLVQEAMAKTTKLKSPSQVDPFSTGQKSLRVVIETPKGSRNKFKFDPEIGTYSLSTVLSEGMVFPYDFGFVPQTKAADGDPLDVLLLMDEPAFTGCVVESRIVGVIEAGTNRGRQNHSATIACLP